MPSKLVGADTSVEDERLQRQAKNKISQNNAIAVKVDAAEGKFEKKRVNVALTLSGMAQAWIQGSVLPGPSKGHRKYTSPSSM